MSSFSQFKMQSKVKLYVVSFIQILIILIISAYIVLAGQTLSLSILIHRQGFYIAWAFSFGLAFGTIILSWWIDKKLNKNFIWTEKFVQRFFLQLIFCFLLMLLIVYAAVRAYFWFLEADFNDSGYMQVEFLIVTWMFVALNLKFIVNEMWPHYVGAIKKDNELKKYVLFIEADTLKAHHVLEVNQIVCFRREGNLGNCWLKNKEKYFIDYKMDELMSILNPALFIQISRSEIFNLSIIEGYDKKKLCILLKEPIDHEIVGKISEPRLAAFIHAFDNYIHQA